MTRVAIVNDLDGVVRLSGDVAGRGPLVASGVGNARGNGSAILGVSYSTGQELQSNSSLGIGTPAEGGWFSNREGIALVRDVEGVWLVSNSDGGQGAEGEVENRTHIDSV